MAHPGTLVGDQFNRNFHMYPNMRQVMSPNPVFAFPPGCAQDCAIALGPPLFFISDRIQYQSGEETISAQRATAEANLQQEYREREALLRNELVELHLAKNMSQQAGQKLYAW